MLAGFGVGWRQVAICFVLMACIGMIAPTYSLFAVHLAKEFNQSWGSVMLSMTVLSGACAIMAPLLGNLMDRVSVRWLMALGGVSLGLGYAAISIATSFTQVLIIFGVFLATANILLGPVAATVLLSRWFAERRGRAMGIAIAGIAAGSFTFPMVIQALLDAYTWREALRLLGLILSLLTVPMALLVVDSPGLRGLFPDGAGQPPHQTKEELAAEPISVTGLFKNPTFWLICLTVAVVTSGMKGMITNLTPLAMDAGMKAGDAAGLISIYAGCGFIAKFNFAMLADRLGPKALMFASLGGFAAGMALLTNAGAGYGAIVLGIATIGLFGGMMVPLESFLASRVFGQRVVGKAMGLISGTILIALLFTPPLFGLIFDLTGSYRGILWTFAGLALVAMLGVRLIRLQQHEPEVPGRAMAAPAE